MTTLYARLTGSAGPLADHTYTAKRLIMQVSMASEINQLGHHLDSMSERNRLSRDFTLDSLVRAIREMVAAFPVYRTYVGDDGREPSARDRAYIEEAVAEAKRRNPTVNVSIFDFVRDVLLVRNPGRPDPDEQAARRHFAMRFQQITGPVTAKGVEDTAFYVYNRLVSLNEVGGDPARFGESPTVFHAKNAARLARWPESLLGDLDPRHQARRGRARPHQRALRGARASGPPRSRRWRALTAALQGGRGRPRRARRATTSTSSTRPCWARGPRADEDESLATLTERLVAYMEKATKEAKRHTSWVNPSAGYDAAMRGFVDRPARARRGLPLRLPALPAAGRGPRGGQFARPDAAQDHRARHPRLLPGHRALGPRAGRSRQPAAGRLRPTDRRCCKRSAPGSRPRTRPRT